VTKILGPYGGAPVLGLLAHFLLSGADVAQAQADAVPPPQVTVIEVRSGRVPIEFEYAARIEASREVEVRAQASGILGLPGASDQWNGHAGHDLRHHHGVPDPRGTI
jgi:multidrug efflux pump subunit AcrA (membrane-fusion protein)